MMKKILAFVLMMTVSVMAVTFTGVNNGDGTVTISYDAPIVGLALNIDSTASVTSVTLDSFFDVFIDYAYVQGESYVYGEGDAIANQDAAGRATLPSMAFCISAGGLEDDETDTVPATGSITLAVDGTGGMTISENTLRGGVVDYNGAMTTNLPITFSPPVPEPLLCAAYDLDGNKFITTNDLTVMVTYMNSLAGSGYFAVVDLINVQYDLDDNNFITTNDLTVMVTYMNGLSGSGYFEMCSY